MNQQIQSIFDKHGVRIVDTTTKNDSFGEAITHIRGHLMDVMNLADFDELENDLTSLGLNVGFKAPNLFLLK